MKLKVLGLLVALAMIGVGVLWTLQGLGELSNEPASRSLATIGPLFAGFGVALGFVTLRGQGRD